MKKTLSLLCVLLLVFSLSACGKNQKDYSNQTIMGKVVSIDGDSVTLQLVEMTVPEDVGEQQSDQMPNMPQGQMPQGGENGTPPEMPDGENGTPSQGQTPPTGDDGSIPESPSGGTMPEGGMQDENGMQPPQNGGQMPDMFTELEDKVTIKLDGVTIKVENGAETTDGTKDSIQIDSILAFEFDGNNTVKTVTVKMQGGTQMPNNDF